jgi:hypothetical protein
MQIGLYLHRSRIGVWRVVSEDSDNFSSWLFMIHGFGDLDDLDLPIHMFFVVVVSLIDIDIANTKELHEQVETIDA